MLLFCVSCGERVGLAAVSIPQGLRRNAASLPRNTANCIVHVNAADSCHTSLT